MNKDPYQELISLINEELKSGADQPQVIDKLVSIGVKEYTAEAIVQELCKPKPYFKILTFIILSTAISTGLFYTVYFLIGVDIIISLTWWMFGLFIGSFGLCSFIDKFNGKIFAIFRIFFSFLAMLFAVFLALTLFMHGDWGAAPSFPSGGRWGVLLRFIVEGFYFIGSTGFALIMTALSFITLIVSWVWWHKFIKGDYSKIE